MRSYDMVNAGLDEKRGQNVMAGLRAATGALHAELDASLPLAAPDAGLDAYTAHLQLLHAWFSQIAPAIARYADGPADFAAASNGASQALVQRDLVAAGLPVDALPMAPHEPAGLAQPAFRWGMQYVIEGSYMGAGVLHRRLAPVLTTCPMYFFGHMANHNKGRWAGFIAAITEQVTGAQAIAEAQAGAVYAFECFIELSLPNYKKADERTRNYA